MPKVKKLNREESLAKLVIKYLQSHGPAQLKDFSWWSGLTLTDAKKAIELVKSQLVNERVDGKEYWHSPTHSTYYKLPTTVFLLFVYDEYFIGYKDRRLILEEKYKKNMAAVGNALLTSLIIINGKVEGTWKRSIKKDKVEIRLNLFRKLGKNEKGVLEEEVTGYGKFLGIPTLLV